VGIGSHESHACTYTHVTFLPNIVFVTDTEDKALTIVHSIWKLVHMKVYVCTYMLAFRLTLYW